MGRCGVLLNSGWPRYSGRVVQPVGGGVRSARNSVGGRLPLVRGGHRGRIYSLDTKTGRECAAVDAVTFSKAVLADGVLYNTSGNTVEARPVAALPIRAAYGSACAGVLI